MEIIVKLLLVHVVCDFFLQSRKWCEAKRSRSLRGLAASSIHALIIALLSYVIMADWSCWWIPVTLLVSHWVIDVCKSWFCRESATSFVMDQLAHVAIICAIAYFYSCSSKVEFGEPYVTWMLYGLSYLLVLTPSSTMIRLFTQQWTSGEVAIDTMTLPNAGKWIGYLERILILTFIYAGHFEGIGFLIAAKSIFRFSDLNKTPDVRKTEYVLLGTLMSFAIGIVIGLIVMAVK
ncbi:MAG: DUF3307 domain-containing protein [Bacteroidales bacterium]|nr:DUF3307 domain-containing protein [Bacteroidales bacterium]